MGCCYQPPSSYEGERAICGIIGLINNEKSKNKLEPDASRFLRQGLISGIFRGMDSTGILRVDNNFNAEVFKSTLRGDEVAQQFKPCNMLGEVASSKAIIIHHRSATKGNVCWDNTHPFEHKLDDERHLIGVHNGGVSASWTEDGKKFNVDSDHLYYRMTRDGAAKALARTKGDFALVWADMAAKKIRIASNEMRSFHFAFVKGLNTVLFASEAAMLYWLAVRNGFELETIYRPREDTIYSFDVYGELRSWSEEYIEKEAVAVISRKKEEPAKASRKSFDIVKRCLTEETPTHTLEDYYGHASFDQIDGVYAGQEYWFEYKNAVQHVEDENMWDVYGDIITTDAEILKAVIFHVSSGTKNLMRENEDIYVKPIGVRDIINKETGKISHLVIMGVPNFLIAKPADSVDKAIAGLGNSVADGEGGDDNDDIAGDRTVRGPGRKHCSVTKYENLVKNGCSRCGDSITTAQSDEIGWVNGDSPVCTDCIGLLEATGYVVE